MTAPETIPGLTPRRINSIRAALLKWYDAVHRKLPWRTHPSPYGTVVSEFMLQQTQVATVIPYYERFLAEFPNFEALAAASEEQVLHAWSGLGYYRRARMLKHAAEVIVSTHGGKLPADPEQLRKLPGFGEYTSGAVGSIALGLVLPIVDGNVRRVVGRLFALDSDLTRGSGKKLLWELCGRLVDPIRPGDFNQGLMELGATVCSPRTPQCSQCPLARICAARSSGEPERFPPAIPREKTREVQEVAVACMRRGRILMLRRGELGAFAGMWELPRLDNREHSPAPDLCPEQTLMDVLGIPAAQAAMDFEFLGETRSVFTHHRIKTLLFRASMAIPNVQPTRHVEARWFKFEELSNLPISKSQLKLLGLLGKP